MFEDDEDIHEISVCRGPRKGCWGKPGPCPNCYRFWSDDSRTVKEIVDDMEKGNA